MTLHFEASNNHTYYYHCPHCVYNYCADRVEIVRKDYTPHTEAIVTDDGGFWIGNYCPHCDRLLHRIYFDE